VEDCFPNVLAGKQCSDFFSRNACNECACDQCGESLFQCADEPGCLTVAQCLRLTGCQGTDCNSPENCHDVIAAHGGPQGRILTMAAALMLCQTTHTCPCGEPQGSAETITCGTHQCDAYVAGDSGTQALSACCFVQGAAQFCGLDVSAIMYSTCEPLAQTGKINTSCPGIQMAEGFPYFGAFLDGCCRPTTADVRDNGGPGSCGYLDTVLGLRCVPPATVDGVTTSVAGDCQYVP
jgi:hypothetical protein